MAVGDSLYLTPQEMRELTGTTRHADQVDVLRASGLRPIVDRRGRPILLREALLQFQLGAKAGDRKPADDGFNLQALASHGKAA